MTSRQPTDDELRELLASFYNDPEDRGPTFVVTHDDEDIDGYADSIVERTQQRGALWAALEDIAALNINSVHGIAVVLDALVGQWNAVAGLITQGRVSLLVRLAVDELREALARYRDLGDSLEDLLSVAAYQLELDGFSSAFAMADHDGRAAAWLSENGSAVGEAAQGLAWLTSDLVDRGELGPTGEIRSPASDRDAE